MPPLAFCRAMNLSVNMCVCASMIVIFVLLLPCPERAVSFVLAYHVNGAPARERLCASGHLPRRDGEIFGKRGRRRFFSSEKFYSDANFTPSARPTGRVKAPARTH